MTEPKPTQDHFLGDSAYNFLKFLALILLPALGTLYFTLAGLWNLPEPTRVIGTITAVDTFLGILLKISSVSYNNSTSKYAGQMNVLRSDDGMKTFQLELHDDPVPLEHKKEVTFKVNRRPLPHPREEE